MLRYFPITGRLYLSDDTEDPPHVIFDTDDAMLCVKPEDVEIGSQAVPARTATSSGVDGTQVQVDIQEDYYIATLDIPRANIVRGMMRVTWDSNPEPADNLWRQASGTHLDILDGVSQTTVPQDDLAGYNRVATLGGYSFLINDLGHLVLRERIVIRCRDSGGPPDNFSRARRAATVSFRLLCGFFLQQDFTISAGLEFKSRYTPSASANITISGANLGYAFAERRIVVVLVSLNDNGIAAVAPATITVGGIAATIHDTAIGSGANEVAISIASVAYPTGTSATINVTYSGDAPWRVDTYIYALKTVSTDTPVITKAVANAATSASIDMTIDNGSMGVVAAASFNSVLPTISNAEIDASSIHTTSAVGVVPAGSGTVTPTATYSVAGDMAIIGAVFS